MSAARSWVWQWLCLFVHPFLNLSVTLLMLSCSCRQTIDQIELKIGWWTHYDTSQAWLTFGHSPLNFCHFLSSDWSNNCCAFADRHFLSYQAQIWWMNSLWDSAYLINFCLAVYSLPVSWPLIGLSISSHLQTNHWSYWAQISGVNSFWDCTVLWLFEQFLHIYRQITDWIELEFGWQTHNGAP